MVGLTVFKCVFKLLRCIISGERAEGHVVYRTRMKREASLGKIDETESAEPPKIISFTRVYFRFWAHR